MMKNLLSNTTCFPNRYRFAVIVLLVVSLGAGLSSCNSQKKLAKKKAEQELAEKTAKAKTDLLAIINDDGRMTLEEKEFKLASVKRMNLDSQEIRDLIGQAEEKLVMERSVVEKRKEEERLSRDKEAREREKLDAGPYMKINQSFDAVAAAGDVTSANMKIREALTNFVNEEVIVLTLISSEGAEKDYDRPTTIRKYLEFIKTRKNHPTRY
ncbi:MAG: hypothetical protein V1775_06955 [Bacteroidota bacterium]